MSTTDRRQSPRVDARDRVRIEILPQGLALRVVDFSYGGFRAECLIPFGPETHEFRVSTVDGVKREVLAAKAVYCHRLGGPGDTPAFVVGFAFEDLGSRQTQGRIHGILDHALGKRQVA
jgi:hypothetical protein